MRYLFALLVTSLTLSLHGQECSMLMPNDVKVMGFKQRAVVVDLDDVETVTLPVVFHVVHTGQGKRTTSLMLRFCHSSMC